MFVRTGDPQRQGKGAARPLGLAPVGLAHWASDHRDGEAPGALQLAGDREGLFG